MSREEASKKNQEGYQLFLAGKYEEALQVFNEAIEIDGEHTPAWLNRSETNRKLGKDSEANADMEKWKALHQTSSKEEAREALVVERRKAGIGDTDKANRGIVVAVIAAVIIGVINLIFYLTGAFGYGIGGLIDTLVVFGLAFGIYKKSRVCAITLFVYWIGSKITIIILVPESILGQLIFGVLFAIFFFRGIQATFAYHKAAKVEAKQEIQIKQGLNP